MKVKTLIGFKDQKEGVDRRVGEEFEVSAERFKELAKTRFGKLVEEVKEKTGGKTVKEANTEAANPEDKKPEDKKPEEGNPDSGDTKEKDDAKADGKAEVEAKTASTDGVETKTTEKPQATKGK